MLDGKSLEEKARAIRRNLLNAIDEVCREEGIPYVLWGMTAVSVAKTGDLALGYPEEHIAVNLKDAARLSELLEALDPQRYRCISWMNSNKYPLLTMRFMDINTTCIDMRMCDSIPIQGLYVEVHMLRPARVDGKSRDWRRRKAWQTERELIWYASNDPTKHLSDIKVRDSKTLKQRIIRMIGESESKRSGNRNFLSDVVPDWIGESGDNVHFTVYEPTRITMRTIPRGYLEETHRDETQSWPLPDELDAFLSLFCKTSWRDMVLPETLDNALIWVSPDVPYAEIERKVLKVGTVDIAKIWDAKEKYNELRAGFARTSRLLTKYRQRIYIVGAARALEIEYAEKRARVLQAYEAGDIKLLEELFSSYRDMLEFVRSSFKGCVLLDDVLMGVFLDILAFNGENGLMDYLYKQRQSLKHNSVNIVQLPMSRYNRNDCHISLIGSAQSARE